MAQKIQMIVSVEDDLDGTDGATEVRKFGVGKHKDRVIDLTEANAEGFDRDVQRWTGQRARRTLTLGRKVHVLSLTADEAARFDADMAPWLAAARRHDKADQHAAGGKDAPGRAKAATAATAAKTARPDTAATDDQAPAQPDPVDLVPVVGEEWWRGNSPLQKRAKGIVRRWAKAHGWPRLGERGRIPAEAFDKWVARVWSTLDEPTWDAAEAASRSRRPRKSTTTPE